MLTLKHIHMSLAGISVLGFIIRAVWLCTQNQRLNSKIVRIAPHVVDTLLLLTGVTLMIVTRQYPNVFSWLAIKLGLVVLYIILGVRFFRATSRGSQAVYFILALGSVTGVAFLAITRPVLW